MIREAIIAVALTTSGAELEHAKIERAKDMVRSYVMEEDFRVDFHSAYRSPVRVVPFVCLQARLPGKYGVAFYDVIVGKYGLWVMDGTQQFTDTWNRYCWRDSE